MMNNAPLWLRTLAIFHTHYEHWEKVWSASQTSFEAERKCVHALRSSAANVGADQLAAAAAALEKTLLNQARHPQNLAPLRAQVLARFLEVRQSTQVVLDWPEGSLEGSLEP